MSGLAATPFHARTAEANACNAWIERGGLTIPEHFGDPTGEALAARFSVVLSDISWRWRVLLSGARAPEGLARLLTRDARTLGTGTAFKALWLNDGGAVRGAGVLARLEEKRFLLVSAAPDRDWLARVAAQFDLEVLVTGGAQGGLALIGPYARATLDAAGLDGDLDLLGFHRCAWRGLEVLISRWGEHGGYEVWCDASDALVAWDRLMRAGRAVGLRAAGSLAMDILDLEAGVARPLRDYMPARTPGARGPGPRDLGLERLIDPEHRNFNGRGAFMMAEAPARVLAGIELDAEWPAPHAPLSAHGRTAGRTLGSLFSPALRRAIALAELDMTVSTPGTIVSVVAPATLERPSAGTTGCVANLPFLPIPGPLAG